MKFTMEATVNHFFPSAGHKYEVDGIDLDPSIVRPDNIALCCGPSDIFIVWEGMQKIQLLLKFWKWISWICSRSVQIRGGMTPPRSDPARSHLTRPRTWLRSVNVSTWPSMSPWFCPVLFISAAVVFVGLIAFILASETLNCFYIIWVNNI